MTASPYTAYSVSWNVTQRCNLECAHCYMSAFAGADTRGELTTDECRRVIDEIATVNPSVFLILTGGYIYVWRKGVLDWGPAVLRRPRGQAERKAA